ncbi:hypothetical protein P280DRAFT_490128 [Massarina eburnea CBS 473.64]|uniref:Uncharacterized protein n=1 Tax=Massarina eburnea CBS 473.64 TaxID=1395130 RepID=A0A6A6S0K5_9PLEO|nr:hypothetical protein P280DRAFT_490128 [Massarina eburnea CBS 473.64]
MPSPYHHLFSTNAVLNVWRNLRHTRDQHDLVLTLQYHPDDVRGPRDAKLGKSNVTETTNDEVGKKGAVVDGRAATDGRSIGFVVPWRSMQTQKRELREKEKELAEALVVLAGEVSFTVRHLAAGLSRQMSKVELQMADNAPFAQGKNLYTGGEIIRIFLPPIQALFEQNPIPQRMIFELLMELKDLVYAGMLDCEKEVLEWELNNFASFEDLDDTLIRALTPLSPESRPSTPIQESTGRKLLRRKASSLLTPAPRLWLHDIGESLYHLESLEATASAMTHLAIRIEDFLAKSAITLRRMIPRSILNDHSLQRRKRTGRCAEYARCSKWAGTSWQQGGGCRRGCKNEDEDPEGLPSWHSTSRWFDEKGTYMVGGGKGDNKGARENISRLVEV